MKRILLYIVFLMCFPLSASAQEPGKQFSLDDGTVNWENFAFTFHPKGKPVKCYTIGSDGKYKDVQYKIYPLKEEHNAGSIVKFVFRRSNYLGIKVNNDLVFVKKGDIAVNTRNYGGKTLYLYSRPDKKSPITFSTEKEHTAPIYDIDGDWVYVKLKDNNGKEVFGWLPPEMQCGSPFTTCP